MKTLASFKRALKPGTKWHAFHVLSNCDMGVRTVAKLQSNKVAFNIDGKNKVSWLQFPKATHYKYNIALKEVEIYSTEDNMILLIYTQV